MKNWIIALSICTLVVCSTLAIPVAAAEPKPAILLPSDSIDMQALLGSNYYFNITISNVPSDQYDVKNGSYYGWCVQKTVSMGNGINSVKLISSYDENLDGFENINWYKINYIINHKQGSKWDVQYAIWNLTDKVNLSSRPIAQAIVDAANQYGSSFVPQSGDIIAIPMVGTSRIQLAFLELEVPPPSLQGLVWYDTDADGIQDGGEDGKVGVAVRLYNNNSGVYIETQTNAEGIYSFGSQQSGDYYLKFILPTGFKFTVKDAGSDDNLDSDADTTTGQTIIFNIPADQTVSITIWDAGMYKPSSGGTPIPPVEPPVKNIRPTADASAGEPYRGFINAEVIFNGSRSYDIDGVVKFWRWNFGDGTNGTGEITTHVYTLPGNYTVTLSVTDDKFAEDVYTTSARITLGNNPPAIPVITGSTSGHASTIYQYTIVSTDPDEDNLRYVINWGDDLQDTSPLVNSGNSIQMTHEWNTAGIYEIQVYAQDTYNATSPTYMIKVSIDVIYAQNLGYLIDENDDGIFDTFHSNATGTETAVKQQTNGKYLIDSNGDGTYDRTYDTTTGQTQQYSEQPLLVYIIIILVILVIAGLLIFYLMKKRKRS